MKKSVLWIGGIILVLSVFSYLGQSDKKAVEEKPVDPVADSIAKRKARIEKAFSAWDGSNRQLEEFVKNAMNDPASYEHDETIHRPIGQDTLFIMMSFRGKNGFGGVVKNTVTVYTDLDGNLISVPRFIR